MQRKLAKTQTAILFVAGSILLAIALFILAEPAGFYAANGIEVGANTSLLNELKAPAGLLLAAGVYLLAAVFVRRLADGATGLGAMIYLSYAAARFGSIWADGMPAPGLLQAAALEAVIGFACVAVLLARRAPARRVA